MTEALSTLNDGYVPELWGVTIDAENAPAVVEAIGDEHWVKSAISSSTHTTTKRRPTRWC